MRRRSLRGKARGGAAFPCLAAATRRYAPPAPREGVYRSPASRYALTLAMLQCCNRESERKREGGRERKRDREREKERGRDREAPERAARPIAPAPPARAVWSQTAQPPCVRGRGGDRAQHSWRACCRVNGGSSPQGRTTLLRRSGLRRARRTPTRPESDARRHLTSTFSARGRAAGGLVCVGTCLAPCPLARAAPAGSPRRAPTRWATCRSQ